MRCLFISTLTVASLLVVGCMSDYVIPEALDRQVDRTATFTDLKRNPEAHKGKTLALGGVVLRAKNLKDGTEIEVLQLPLDRSDQPDYPLEASQGRFLVLDPDHHDPAVLKDRRITLVGEVIGKKVETIDEFEYSFPYLSARFIHIWPERRGYAYDRSYYPAYYPYPYYYYPDPYWYPPFWYNRPPVFIPPTNPPPRRFQAPAEKESPPQAPNDQPQRRFEKKSSE
ncbi:MAG: Slp family lipoprotein [Nitrospirae bacterium]|nr:Slp family lipoprotein [Nitrospirota bacterium]